MAEDDYHRRIYETIRIQQKRRTEKWKQTKKTTSKGRKK